MSDKQRPVIGASMSSTILPDYAEWLLAAQRDLELIDPVYPNVLDGDWQAVVRQARSVLDGYNGRMGVHAPFYGIDLIGVDPKVRSVTVERFSQCIEFTQALGGTHMVLHSPFEFFGHPQVAESPTADLPRKLEFIHKTLDPIVMLAQEAGVILVVETIHDTHTRPLLTLIDTFGSEFVQMSIDVGHTYITHLHGGPSPDQWVREAGSRLAHLHIQDTDGLDDRHWAPGCGSLNWYAFFEALDTLEVQPRMVLELHDYADIPRGAQWLAEQGYTR